MSDGARIYVWLTPALIAFTVPTDDTSGGVEMYRGYQAHPQLSKVGKAQKYIMRTSDKEVAGAWMRSGNAGQLNK